jgi:hypothetical protein
VLNGAVGGTKRGAARDLDSIDSPRDAPFVIVQCAIKLRQCRVGRRWNLATDDALR